MRNKIKGSFIFTGAIIFLMPLEIHAALVPCGKSGEEMCTLCDIILGLYALANWGIKIMVIAAVVSITIGGILYIVSAGNSGLMGMAKNAIKYAIIGIVVMLCAVIIVNTVMRVLATKADLGIGVDSKNGWKSFSCMSK